MNKLKVFMFAALLTLSSCGRHADSGRWSGNAIYSDDFGRTVSCSNIQVDVTHDEKYLDIDKSVSNCNLPTYMWGPAALEIHDETIWNGAVLVGTTQRDGSGRIELYDRFRNMRVFLSWQRSGQYLIYTEEVHGSGYDYKITGTLERSFRR